MASFCLLFLFLSNFFENYFATHGELGLNIKIDT
jgi:hypothetical protein